MPGANPECSGVDIFEIAIKKLEEHFIPKQSRVYERHVFRLQQPDLNEKFNKMLVTLRNQAENGKFDKPVEHLIHQMVAKYTSAELRKKILRLRDDITLGK